GIDRPDAPTHPGPGGPRSRVPARAVRARRVRGSAGVGRAVLRRVGRSRDPGEGVMSQVNLLPPDILQGQRYRRLTLTVLAAGAIVLALIVVFFFIQVGRLGAVNDDIAAKEQTNAELQSQIDSLQKYDDLQTQAQQAQTQLDAAYAGEVSFSGMLMDLSRVIPSDAYLDTFTA